MSTVRLLPIPSSELTEVRRRGVDARGRPAEPFAAEGGEQLRCCLATAVPGEGLLVVGHAPLAVPRPWQEVGPVFGVLSGVASGVDPVTLFDVRRTHVIYGQLHRYVGRMLRPLGGTGSSIVNLFLWAAQLGLLTAEGRGYTGDVWRRAPVIGDATG
ncbi:MAG: DUF1203 domain-containing protein [Phycicoccus sp.]